MRAVAFHRHFLPRIAREVPRRFQGGLGYMYAVFKPVDPTSAGSWEKSLTPLTLQRRGPDLLSLVCVQSDESAATTWNGVVDAGIVRGDNILRGDNDDAKLSVGGAAVVYPFQIGSSADESADLMARPFLAAFMFLTSVLFGGSHGAREATKIAFRTNDYNPADMDANAGHGYGVVRTRDESGVEVEFVGPYDPSQHAVPDLVYLDGSKVKDGTKPGWVGYARPSAFETGVVGGFEKLDFFGNPKFDKFEKDKDTGQAEGGSAGWIARARPGGPIVAHAQVRNILITDTLRRVRHELALLWPEPIARSAVTFVDAVSGSTLSEAELRRHTASDLFRREVYIRVGGARVELQDPTGVTPMGWWREMLSLK